MCGVAALFRLADAEVPNGTLEAMTAAVAHRGPDGDGTLYLDLGGGPWRVALGHRRLAILDLGEGGRQPMTYRDGLWITYNGEVYNYVELRRELERLGHVFTSRTDTEVILAAWHEWGDSCFERFRGMWGMVLVDVPRRRAVVTRDRLGIKPLYLARSGHVLAAVSEPKQLRWLPGFRLVPDAAAVGTYLANGFENADSSFFRDVTPTRPGTFQVIDLDTCKVGDPVPYWFPERVSVAVTCHDEAARMFCDVLDESVGVHLRSDVPVGCALSGGLDSSAIAGLLGARRGELATPLQTFSAVFPGHKIDEGPWVERVVRHTGAAAHFTSPTPQEFLRDLDDFLWKHDEPVGSLSQYAGYAVARLTRRAGVPVTLNGQGGDEILSGYWQCYLVYLRRMARERQAWDLGLHLAGALLPGGNAEIVWQAPAMLRRYRSRLASAGSVPGPAEKARDLSPEAWRVYEVRELTLPRLLKWDDRNFMAFSVEGRYPFLDHRMIELCLSFAPAILYDRGWTKEPLRRGLRGRLPDEVLRRRSKVGFETPQDAWLAGALAAPVSEAIGGDSPAWDFMEPARARTLAESARRRTASREEHQALFRIFMLDRWLRMLEAA